MKVVIYNQNYEKVNTYHFVKYINMLTNKVVLGMDDGIINDEVTLIKDFDYSYIHIYRGY